MNEPTPEQLLALMNNPGFSRNTRYMVLNYQLYLEHYVNEIVSFHAKEVLHETLRDHLEFGRKIAILEKLDILSKDTAQALRDMTRFRNLMVHQLQISEEEIWKKLKNYKFSYKILYKGENEEEIDLEKEYKKYGFNKLDQFRTSAALLVGILYTKLKRLKGEELDQFFYPRFEEKDGKIQCWINLMKKPE